MKTIKRILAVLLLIALGLGVGYLCYTCSRLPSDAEIYGLAKRAKISDCPLPITSVSLSA